MGCKNDKRWRMNSVEKVHHLPFIAHAAKFFRKSGQVVRGNKVDKKFYEVDKMLIINLIKPNINHPDFQENLTARSI
jgi:hypothetical protein